MSWIQECFPEYKILVEYDNIDNKQNKQEIHGLRQQKNVHCMFCGTPFSEWHKKDVAHAISECVGNKALFNFCECYDCNHLFGEIAENHLGKFLMPYRIINEIYGKGKFRNIVKDIPVDKNDLYKSYRFEQAKNTPVLQSDTYEIYNMLIEKEGSGRLTKTETGFRLSIPRQTYNPYLVYASLLKMAFTLLPENEINYYRKEICRLYLAISLAPVCNKNGEEIIQGLTEADRQAYLNGLPNQGIEICQTSASIPQGVNVCLLKRNDKTVLEPQILFAIQMKWYTVVIPIYNDDYNFGEKIKFKIKPNKNKVIRTIDFSKIEKEFICEMTGMLIDIPKEVISELEDILRNKRFLKANKQPEGSDHRK